MSCLELSCPVCSARQWLFVGSLDAVLADIARELVAAQAGTTAERYVISKLSTSTGEHWFAVQYSVAPRAAT